MQPASLLLQWDEMNNMAFLALSQMHGLQHSSRPEGYRLWVHAHAFYTARPSVWTATLKKLAGLTCKQHVYQLSGSSPEPSDGSKAGRGGSCSAALSSAGTEAWTCRQAAVRDASRDPMWAPVASCSCCLPSSSLWQHCCHGLSSPACFRPAVETQQSQQACLCAHRMRAVLDQHSP